LNLWPKKYLNIFELQNSYSASVFAERENFIAIKFSTILCRSRKIMLRQKTLASTSFVIQNESVEKLFSERNFQISREKNEEEEGILGSKYVAD